MPQDLLLDDHNDLKIVNGDFVIGESTLQHQGLLLTSAKGDWKENPISGVGVAEWLKDDDTSGMLAEIKLQFERDGMTVINNTIDSTGNLNLDAHY